MTEGDAATDGDAGSGRDTATGHDVGVGADAWAAAVELVASCRRAGGRVAVTGHVEPDGDSLGSVLATVLGLRAVGVDAVGVLVGEVPRSLALLPTEHLVPPAEVGTAAVVVSVDASSPDRLGDAAELLATAEGGVVVLDHHAHGRTFGDVRLVDPAAPATVVLVLGLLDRLGAPLDLEIATCLYVGLVTDTGYFRYSATTSETHTMAARLLAAGVRPELVAESLARVLPHPALRLTGKILSRSVLEPGVAGRPGLVWSSVANDELTEFRVAPDEIVGVIDELRAADEAEVAMFLRQDVDGRWQVSLRSRGAVDVGAVCAAFGGGGHARAAGFTSPDTMVKTVGAVRRALAAPPAGRTVRG